MPTVGVQFNHFVLTLTTGLLLGVVFDFYRSFTGCIRFRKFWLNFGDLLIWLAAAGFFFTVLLYTRAGELRFYSLLSLGMGYLFYRLTFGRIIYSGFTRFFAWLRRLARNILDCISKLQELCGKMKKWSSTKLRVFWIRLKRLRSRFKRRLQSLLNRFRR